MKLLQKLALGASLLVPCSHGAAVAYALNTAFTGLFDQSAMTGEATTNLGHPVFIPLVDLAAADTITFAANEYAVDVYRVAASTGLKYNWALQKQAVKPATFTSGTKVALAAGAAATTVSGTAGANSGTPMALVVTEKGRECPIAVFTYNAI